MNFWYLQFRHIYFHAIYPFTLSYIIGIVSYLYYPMASHVTILLSLGGTAGSILGFVYTKNITRTGFLLVGISTIAFFAGRLRIQTVSTRHRCTQDAIRTHESPIYATIKDIQPTPYCRWKEIITLQRADGYYIQWYTHQQHTLAVGDSIHLPDSKISLPSHTHIQTYLAKEHIVGFLHGYHNYTIITTPRISLTRGRHRLRTTLQQEICKKLSPVTGMLFSTLFLGYRQTTSDSRMKQTFRQWGISHYLARSGLHMSIFISILYVLLMLIPVNFLLKQLLIILCSTIYILLSWTSISFYRACLLFLLSRSSLIFTKHTQTAHLLILITLITLYINPFYLFFIDFQLSFGLSFALAWLFQTKLRPRFVLIY